MCGTHPASTRNGREGETVAMTYQTTIGWSLVTSGLVSLSLWLIPGDSVWWGLGLLVLGIVILYIRRDDVSEAFAALTGS